VQEGNAVLGKDVDILFSVTAVLDPIDSGTLDFEMQQVVEETGIKFSDGETSGEFTATREGMLRIAWSNAHSTLRPKTVKFEVNQEEKADQL